MAENGRVPPATAADYPVGAILLLPSGNYVVVTGYTEAGALIGEPLTKEEAERRIAARPQNPPVVAQPPQDPIIVPTSDGGTREVDLTGTGMTPDTYAELQLAKAFGFKRDPKTEAKQYFRLAKNFKSTTELVAEAVGPDPDNIPPAYVYPWECRIGGSLFSVPPVNINVSTSFRAGSLSGGALRSTSSPKFNSGYSETVINMTLYFPNHDSIWGFGDADEFTINFDDVSEKNYHIIDRYLSSLRGLITQFRYAPFLPVRNSYLNAVYGITGVALQGLTVSNVPGYPYCLVANLTLLKFNHKVYLPMIEHFDNAIHWGKFRQYMGRAAARLTRLASQNFLTKEGIPTNEHGQPVGNTVPSIATAKEMLQLDTAEDVLNRYEAEDLNPLRTFKKRDEILGGMGEYGYASHFELFHPYTDPARIDIPSLQDFAVDPSEEGKVLKAANWWQALMSGIGINVLRDPLVSDQDARRLWEDIGNNPNISSEWRLLTAYTDHLRDAEKLTMTEFEKHYQRRLAEKGLDKASEGTKEEFRTQLRSMWFASMYHMFMQDPEIAKRLAIQDMKRKKLWIQEWEVPMVAVGLNDLKDYVKVQHVNVSMGNNLARMQIQMQPEPVHQHIGGLDTSCSISMLVFGEEPLMKLRTAFETLGGLARIEHGHGVLGFLGIKNAITALCGMKYCMASGFEVDTIPNMPHCYEIRLTLTDFDIFQQKREMLSPEQQAHLITTFKTKKNPFLRIKQIWGAFNAYPDFPLAVHETGPDGKKRIVGNLDPDYYFKGYETIHPDLFDFGDDPKEEAEEIGPVTGQETRTGMDYLREDGVHWSFGKYNDQYGDWLSTTKNGISVHEGAKEVFSNYVWNEMTAENTLVTPSVTGLTPPGGPEGYVKPLEIGQGDHFRHYKKMVQDLQYRDKTGRMIRAFPTYMLWLINEQGHFGGVKLFDNFYGLQSVIDMSIHQSEDIMGDTLVLRISNIYSRLSTPFGDLLDERFSKTATIINAFSDQHRRLLTGQNDYMVSLDTVEISPGARLHLRLGYSSNPNAMDTVFNGTVTSVEQGEILTIIAQSDAIELGALVNSTNPKGHSGKIDGNLTGLYMSEPRDLMIRLLTMGSGVFKETFANATEGKVFSENRFGIRHFGSILYQEMTDEEHTGKQARRSWLQRHLSTLNPFSWPAHASGVVGLMNEGMADITDDLWVNMSLQPDYELFKRNIYPGNGSGIAQYMGGDLGEGALNLAMMPTGVDPTGVAIDASTGERINLSKTPSEIVAASYEINDQLDDQTDTTMEKLGSTFGVPQTHAFFKAMGLMSRGDDDMWGFDEVSFRAQTHMKTVWDMFQTCAALLPNYIVATRPFEDRSTIFYGKPHWTYTSGVIPLTLGSGLVQDAEGNTVETGPDYIESDKEWQELFDKLTEELGMDRQNETFYQKISGVASVDPTDNIRGVTWSGEDPTALPSQDANGAKLPSLPGDDGKGMKSSVVQIGMHLPVRAELEKDTQHHEMIEGLPPDVRHPFYMDRASSDPEKAGEERLPVEVKTRAGTFTVSVPESQSGGDNTNEWKEDGAATFFKSDKGEWNGKMGAFGYFDQNDQVDEDEQWYIAMPWSTGEISVLRKAKILVWSPRTRRGVVCTPGDIQKEPTLSPDAIYALGVQPGKDVCFFGFVDRETMLGPVDLASYVRPGAPDGIEGPDHDDATEGGFLSTGLLGGTKEILAQATNAYLRDFRVDAKTGKMFSEVHTALEKSNQNIKKATSGFDWLNDGVTDPAKFAYEFGWQKDHNDVPVNFGGALSDPDSGLIDEAGAKAELLYRGHRSDKEANKIWKEFRKHFANEEDTKNGFKNAYPQFKGERKVDLGGGKTATLQATGARYDPDAQKWYDKSGKELKVVEPKEEDSTAFEKYYTQVMDEFMKFMWQNPYHRGWLVRTVDTKFSLVSGVLRSVLGGTLGGLGAAAAASTGFGVLASGAVFSAGMWVGNRVTGLLEKGWDLTPWGDDEEKREWDFHNARKAWEIFISPQDGPAAATTWMQEHKGVGKHRNDLFGRIVEEAYDKTVKPAKELIGQIGQAIGGIYSTVSAFVKLAMMQMSQGVDGKSDMQKRTNLLNRIFNDSVYYRAGPAGSIIRLADNPFTREYGEPVVEIREPFQRVHFLSSFEHILKNQIIERTEGVNTVITATSNNKHPVTVHFDKGASPEFQREAVVDTGLYWDHVGGVPILKSIPIIGTVTKPLAWIFNPVKAMRGGMKDFNNSSDEVSSKRVALWHLRESLKDIYGGELTILGDAGIRPFDLVYLSDVYERMYGFFEVEAVTHHFTPETGFITSVVPNALVSVNDPARWTMTGYLDSRFAALRIRRHIQSALNVRQDQNIAITTTEDSYTEGDIVKILEDQIMDSTQYSGGMNKIVSDVMSAVAGGMLVGGPLAIAAAPATIPAAIAGAVGVVLGGGIIWSAWEWIRDNLLDQHGCYIQYLTHMGQPMDAGMSANSSCAVGRTHGVSLAFKGLTMGKLSAEGDVSGAGRITTSELLTQLGYAPRDLENLHAHASMFVSDTYIKLQRAMQRGDPLPGNVDVLWVKVAKVRDGDTIEVEPVDGDMKGYSKAIRMAIVDAPEDDWSDKTKGEETWRSEINSHQPGVLASQYTRARLQGKGPASGFVEHIGHGSTIAIRVLRDMSTDIYGRTLGYIFHQGLPGQSDSDRRKFLEFHAANGTDWQSYTKHGKPLTYNQELMNAGHANVEVNHLRRSLPGMGVVRSGG